MPAFYAPIHEIVGELMYADNFYIALYDEERQLINFPFSRRGRSATFPTQTRGTHWDRRGPRIDRIRASARQAETPRRQRITRPSSEGEFEIIGKMAIEWMGAP